MDFEPKLCTSSEGAVVELVAARSTILPVKRDTADIKMEKDAIDALTRCRLLFNRSASQHLSTFSNPRIVVILAA